MGNGLKQVAHGESFTMQSHVASRIFRVFECSDECADFIGIEDIFNDREPIVIEGGIRDRPKSDMRGIPSYAKFEG